MPIGGGLMQLVTFGPQDYSRNAYKRRIPTQKERQEKENRQNKLLIYKKLKLKERKLKNSLIHDRLRQTLCITCMKLFDDEEYIVIRNCGHVCCVECTNENVEKCTTCELLGTKVDYVPLKDQYDKIVQVKLIGSVDDGDIKLVIQI